MTKGANASPRMNIENVICVSVGEMRRSCWILGRAGAIIEVVMRVTSWPRLVIRAVVILRVKGHL